VIGWFRYGSPYAHNSGRFRIRYNPDRCRDEVFGYVIRPVNKTGADGWGACLWSLNSGPRGPKPGIHTLARRSRLKRGWGPICRDGAYLHPGNRK
jgi:hypothetical protein